MSKTYWHFAKIENGNPVMRDGTIIEIGKEYHVEKAELCESGYHGSARIIDALQHAPGPWISKRIITGDIKKGKDKVCGKRCIHTKGFDATEILRKFTCMCALDVIHLWDAPTIVIKYLKTGDKSIRSDAWAAAVRNTASAAASTARDAARAAADAARWDTVSAASGATLNAARATAWDTVRDDAWDAARGATWNAVRDDVMGRQNRRLTRMINKALKEVDDE